MAISIFGNFCATWHHPPLATRRWGPLCTQRCRVNGLPTRARNRPPQQTGANSPPSRSDPAAICFTRLSIVRSSHRDPTGGIKSRPSVPRQRLLCATSANEEPPRVRTERYRRRLPKLTAYMRRVRPHLLYGPPGTGKSSMVAAMANFLDYDVYDLELTSVEDNTALRRLMINTTSKSIIIIEDIDCSLDLTGKRKKKKEKVEEGDPLKPKMPEEGQNESKVTLSGLLNFIDGLWSSCGGERVIVFTTNHVEKLDAALVRRGRMDKHIEMTYCSFGAFKVLARNYLGVENHHLFPKVEELLGEVQITPADVAECLMSNRRRKMVTEMDDDQAVDCLVELLATMEEMKANKKGGGGDDVAVVDDQEGEAATVSVEAN